MSISNFVKATQNIMRMDAGVDGDAQRITQLVWMLFLRVFDVKEAEWELTEDDYSQIIPEKYQWRNWAEDEEGITGDDLLDFINNGLFKDIGEMPIDENTDRRKVLVREIFSESSNYMKSGTLMREVINKINDIDFESYEERHAFNDIYETILKDLQSAGNAGEFYTPRSVTDFIIDRLNPTIGETVADFACGTGGFLVSALHHMAKKENGLSVDEYEVLQKSLHGVEKKIMPYMLCVTNLILNDIDYPNILHGNSLTKNIRDFTDEDKFDVVAMNPPFGGSEEDTIKTNFPAEYRTKETADLFLAVILHRLKFNGRCGIVLPDGFLFGDDSAKPALKRTLLEELNLHTIVRLPSGVFAPYAPITVNLLFFNNDGTSTEDIWYYEVPLPDGFKSFSKTKPFLHKYMEPVKEWWDDRQENERAWKVNAQNIIKNNYNMDIKNPNSIYEGHNYTLPELIKAMEHTANNITTTIDKIKELI